MEIPLTVGAMFSCKRQVCSGAAGALTTSGVQRKLIRQVVVDSGRNPKQERQDEGRKREKGIIPRTKLEEIAFAKSNRLYRSPQPVRMSMEMPMQTTLQKETVEFDIESPTSDVTTDPFKRLTPIEETIVELAGKMSGPDQVVPDKKLDKNCISQAWKIKTTYKMRKNYKYSKFTRSIRTK
ncbi:hypothetical protein FQR65_LT11092 [Abscondita terminalis]|nr:hypothetical protein FQR65_LT11092 [Abscondita terminalis]